MVNYLLFEIQLGSKEFIRPLRELQKIRAGKIKTDPSDTSQSVQAVCEAAQTVVEYTATYTRCVSSTQ
jgi:hypothetical protein